ncbi:MAG: 30S ribosomal protein S15 [Candidatus Omnitrophota bacterium]
MSVLKEKKQEIIGSFKKHDTDTGSAEVQIALLSERIINLAEHFKKHKKDFHSRRGLLLMVNKRRKLLKYVKTTNEQKYKEVIAKLGLRK